jgi:predicted NUDIX family NTP pyrophosphohydrolase
VASTFWDAAEIPEIDRGEWFTIAPANEKILAGQRGFLDQLLAELDSASTWSTCLK